MSLRKAFLSLFCCCLFASVSAQPDISFERKYIVGEKYYYELTTEYYQNLQWKSSTVSVCELTVGIDSSGIPFESLQWLSQKVITASDTSDESSLALSTKAYFISLHPKGSLKLPVITEPRMTGAITDFNTFYVAVHDKAGMRKLRKPGDTYESPLPIKGNFGNGKTILKGEDCISLSSKLIEVKKGLAIVQTNFDPPQNTCLDYYLPEMAKPVSGDTVNNVQMIIAAGNNKLNLQYGKESFDIVSNIGIATGMLQEAHMTNELFLKLKVACSNKEFTDCQAEMPWRINRKLKLRLLP